ncbi:MAG: hypothetical protein K1Y36_18495 [Blastocatellia bacterium]|nr:hypothetical protein [Blastocatellia bacterium]
MPTSAQTNFRVWVLLPALICLGWACWLGGFRLHSEPGETGVFRFLTVFGFAFAGYGIALWSVAGATWNQHNKLTLWAILVSGLILRLFLLPAGISEGVSWEKIQADLTGKNVVWDRFLLYDHDVWRYLWDGHQQAVGVNPYRYAPAELEPYASPVLTNDPQLEERLFPSDFWRDEWEYINYKEIPTIYPPLLQGTFRLSHRLAPGSVLVFKFLLLLADLGVCAALAWVLKELRLPVWTVAIYAWNPLVIKEIAGSAHADAIPALCLVLALGMFLREKPIQGSIWLALGVLAKLTPLVLLPLVWRKMGWRGWMAFVLVVLSGYAPFLDAGGALFQGFSVYSREWVFNPGLFELFRWLALNVMPTVNPSLPAKVCCGLLFLAVVIWRWRRPVHSPQDFAENWLWVLGGLVVLSSAVMPWYLVWILPLAALTRRFTWVVFSALCLLSYWVYIRGDGIEEPWRLGVIHAGFYLTLLLEKGLRTED